MGISPQEFLQLTPAEFEYALEDYKLTQFTPMKRICETVRVVGQVVHNSAFGRKRSDMIRNPSQLIKFGWEGKPKIQTVEQMRETILALSSMKGVKVTQKGKEVNFTDY